MSVKTKMTAIADAIRNKTGGAEPLSIDGMAAAIGGIQTGGGAALLFRAEVTEPVSLIDITIQEEWKQYFAWIVCPCQLTFNTGEWLCLSTNVGGNHYVGATGSTANAVFDAKHSEMIFSFAADKAYFANEGNPAEFDSAKLTRIRFTPYYYDKNTIISGAIEIYGVKL